MSYTEREWAQLGELCYRLGRWQVPFRPVEGELAVTVRVPRASIRLDCVRSDFELTAVDRGHTRVAVKPVRAADPTPALMIVDLITRKVLREVPAEVKTGPGSAHFELREPLQLRATEGLFVAFGGKVTALPEPNLARGDSIRLAEPVRPLSLDPYSPLTNLGGITWPG